MNKDEFIVERKVALTEEQVKQGKMYLKMFPDVEKLELRDITGHLLAIIGRTNHE